ncbi:MAG: hypothetical protein EOP09_20930 [Proteobacteria bacterium]|nr:MAG: hypothetical protein EOP09_20930 [Pseudomonadota bacterium]
MKHRDDRNNNGQQYNNQQTGQGRNTKNFTADHDYGYGYGYGSTQESRDFRNQPEERYQSAMDFGSHTYDPNAHHGQSYPHENSRSQNSRSHGSHDSERHGQRQWRGSGRDPQDAWQSRHNEGRGQEREERGYNDPRYSSSESNRMMERTSAFGAQTYGSQGAGYTSHAGKGPKGYKRSDDRIKEEVCDLIMRHDEIDGSDIEKLAVAR